jgi:hypothetical protein
MTVVSVKRPTVFEADLPTVSYEDAATPAAAHEALKQARHQFPIAMGSHGPEILSYELAHTALRDHRLAPPPGLGLEAQGITSGALWVGSLRLFSASTVRTTLVCADWCPRHSPRGR